MFLFADNRIGSSYLLGELLAGAVSFLVLRRDIDFIFYVEVYWAAMFINCVRVPFLGGEDKAFCGFLGFMYSTYEY